MTDDPELRRRVRDALASLGEVRDPDEHWTELPDPVAAAQAAPRRPIWLAAAAAVALIAVVGAWWASSDRDGTVASPTRVPSTTTTTAVERALVTSTSVSGPPGVECVVVAPTVVVWSAPSPPTTVVDPASDETYTTVCVATPPGPTAPTVIAPTTTLVMPAPAPPVVVVKVGTPAQGQPGCTVTSCAYLAIEASGLAPNTDYGYQCFAEDGGGFGGGGVLTSDPDGEIDIELPCYFGFPGQRVAVELTLRSEWLEWPAE